MDPLDKIKSAGIERFAGQITPSNIPAVHSAAGMMAGIEANQAEALNDAAAAAGLDYALDHDHEARQGILLEVADALASQSFRSWWFDRFGEEYVDDPEAAIEYAGLDADEWHQQIRTWYRQAYERGLVDEPIRDADPGQIGEAAARTVDARFGCDLNVFVAAVVNWSKRRELRRVVAGTMDTHTAVIEDLQRVIERKNERIEELEAEADE